MNQYSWSCRGWCRMEQILRELSTANSQVCGHRGRSTDSLAGQDDKPQTMGTYKSCKYGLI